MTMSILTPLEIPLVESPESDLVLLERYRDDDDQQAFAEIVRRYAAAVFSTAMRVLGDRARADDVAQETFFRLSQKPEMVRQSLGGWLHTAATRLAIDAVRSEASRAHREATYERPGSSESMQWADISPHVDEALSELPDETRVLLVRHFLQNVSQCTLAGELRTSPATVSRKIKAGVESLRKQLRKKGVCIAGAMLVTLMREYGAQAAPAELMQELGKITMLSGGKPAVATPAPFSCGFWWVSSIASLAVVFAGLYVASVPDLNAPPPAPTGHVEERRAEAPAAPPEPERLARSKGAGVPG
jgi:RNA polymerase sigma-70 factor (ECF subfamily)